MTKRNMHFPGTFEQTATASNRDTPQFKGLGGQPSIIPDVPINAVILVLFMLGAAMHLFIFKRNKSKGRKFIFSALIFASCMSRIVATIIRIAWACQPHNIRLEAAAQILTYAGATVLLIVNLFFAQRILRAQHPHAGWSTPVTVAIPVLLFIIISTVFCLIVAMVVEFYYARGRSQLRTAGGLERYGLTLFAIIAFLPIPAVSISTIAHARASKISRAVIDNFGTGTMRTKVLVVLLSACILCLGASFRGGAAFHPIMHPERGYSKACFYIFDFGLEIILVALWAALRVDQRFYVPDGAQGPYAYSGCFPSEHTGEASHGSVREGFPTRQPSHLLKCSEKQDGEEISSPVSWGGLSLEKIMPTVGGTGFESPYPASDPSSPAEVGITGADNVMGWEPMTGKWHLRCVSAP